MSGAASGAGLTYSCHPIFYKKRSYWLGLISTQDKKRVGRRLRATHWWHAAGVKVLQGMFNDNIRTCFSFFS